MKCVYCNKETKNPKLVRRYSEAEGVEPPKPFRVSTVFKTAWRANADTSLNIFSRQNKASKSSSFPGQSRLNSRFASFFSASILTDHS